MSSKPDYRHIEKDPIIDLIRTEAQRVGGDKLSGAFLESIAHKSGVTSGTLRNWFFHDTKRPQHLTVRFVLEALGCRIQVVRIGEGTVVRGPRGNE